MQHLSFPFIKITPRITTIIPTRSTRKAQRTQKCSHLKSNNYYSNPWLGLSPNPPLLDTYHHSLPPFSHFLKMCQYNFVYLVQQVPPLLHCTAGLMAHAKPYGKSDNKKSCHQKALKAGSTKEINFAITFSGSVNPSHPLFPSVWVRPFPAGRGRGGRKVVRTSGL